MDWGQKRPGSLVGSLEFQEQRKEVISGSLFMGKRFLVSERKFWDLAIGGWCLTVNGW